MRIERSLLTIAFVVLTAGCLLASLQLSPSSAWIAQVVLTVTLLLLLLQLAVEQLPLRGSRGSGDAEAQAGTGSRDSATRNGSLLPALAWIAALPFAVWLLGTALGSSLFCLAWLRWHSGERWAFSCIFSLLLGVGVQLLFGVLLRADLGWGVLFRLVS